jgi:hypothetical protein
MARVHRKRYSEAFKLKPFDSSRPLTDGSPRSPSLAILDAIPIDYSRSEPHEGIRWRAAFGSTRSPCWASRRVSCAVITSG